MFLASAMFSNVVIGTPDVGKSEDWPELGQKKTERRQSEARQPRVRPNSSQESLKPSNSMENAGVIPDNSNRHEKHLDSFDFPVLSQVPLMKIQKHAKPTARDVPPGGQAKHRKKKIKKSTPFQIDICEIIQASALKKKRKSEISALRRSSKLKRKILTGNLLDSDQPKRHKGKVRPWKPRDLSKTKKIICTSRKVRLPRLPFTRDLLRFKENLGLALRNGDVDVSRLADGLTGISLDEAAEPAIDSTTADATLFAKNIIHNKKFRPYCSNIVTHEVKKHASDLVVMLRKFQDRMHAKDEIKAHAKRRYVCGFNESTKFLLADRVKLLIVATNLEMEEGLPSMAILKKMLDAADEKKVSVIYGGLAQNIGYWALKKAKISVLAVMNYDGANETHANLMAAWTNAKEEYTKLLRRITDLYLTKSSRAMRQEAFQKEVEDEIKETILRKLKEL